MGNAEWGMGDGVGGGQWAVGRVAWREGKAPAEPLGGWQHGR